MSENYYQSAHAGKTIDDAISRIASGEFDQLAAEAVAAGATAQNAAVSARNEAVKAEDAKTAAQQAASDAEASRKAAADSEANAKFYAAQCGGGAAGSGVGIASVTQTTTSTEDGGENVITVTLTDGTESTFSVRNGSKGSPGAAPVKGTDYWTDEDKAEMVSEVLSKFVDVSEVGL